MKSTLYLIVLLLFCVSVSAQISQSHKIVYLKDGTNVKGTVTINDSAGYVMVVDNYKETHYYQKSMVAKIEDQVIHSRSYDLKSKGYVCNIEIGGSDILAKDGGANIPSLSFNVVNSYLFSPYVSLGLGLGTELASSGVNVEMFSIYADSRIYFVRSNISPYLNLDLGYNGMFQKYATSIYNYPFGNYIYTNHNDGNHGFMFNPSFGIRVAANKKLAITAGAGYKVYYLETNRVYYTLFRNQAFVPDAHGYYFFNALTLKVGFQF